MVTLNINPNGDNNKLVGFLLLMLVIALIVFIFLQCAAISYLIIQEIRM